MLNTKLPSYVRVEREELQNLLVYAVKFSLYLNNSLAQDVCTYVMTHKKALTDQTKFRILQAIKDIGPLEDTREAETWVALRSELEGEL